MATEDEVRTRIRGLSDEDLLEMISRPVEDYTSFAREMAIQELTSRGGADAVQQERAAEATAQERSAKATAAAISKGLCPSCQKPDVSRRSGWLTPLLFGLGWIALNIAWQEVAHRADLSAVAVFAPVNVFLFAATLLSGWKALFGRNRCKACGYRWR